MAPLAARARKKPATHRLTYGAGMTSEPAAGTLSAVGSCTQESKSGTHRTSTRYPCASLSTTLSRFRRISVTWWDEKLFIPATLLDPSDEEPSFSNIMADHRKVGPT